MSGSSSAEDLLALLAASRIGVLKVDAQGIVQACNEAAAQRLGVQVGGRLPKLRCNKGLELERVIRGSFAGSGCTQRWLARDRERGERFELSWVPVDETHGCLLVLADDALGKLRRKLEQRLNDELSKLEIATRILHDIGNAITGLGTRAAQLNTRDRWREQEHLARLSQALERQRGALEEAFGPGKGQAMLAYLKTIEERLSQRRQTVVESAEVFMQATAHVQEILSIHRSYLRRNTPDGKQRFHLSALLSNALAMLRGGFDKRAVEIEWVVPPGLPPLRGDRTRLVRVFLNLLKNACESFDQVSGPGQRRVMVRVETAHDHVEVLIEDNGAGFTGEGERFFESGITNKPGGTGLGLPVVREIVEAHGGRVGLVSPGVGQGAVAWVELPIPES